MDKIQKMSSIYTVQHFASLSALLCPLTLSFPRALKRAQYLQSKCLTNSQRTNRTCIRLQIVMLILCQLVNGIFPL